tara:strand:+ start:1173 stop:1802 length:630 start_codon:yes stop_codon:yes gene_type:complete
MLPDTEKPLSKTGQRREDLRNRLTDIAETRIAAEGLAAIKARDLAREAECAVGAIYNVFTDMNGLVMAVNGRTFRRLGKTVAAATAAAPTGDPQANLVTMSLAYLRFAAENTNLWRALFDLDMSTDMPVPHWYLAELAQLFTHIAAPLAQLFPDFSRQELDLMTRALFSSVHGIVLLGLQKRISGVPLSHLEQMIAILLRNVTSQHSFS